MRLFKLLMSLGATLALAACAVTEPVVVIEQSGRVLSGSTTAALSGGHFSVTDGKLTCGGRYNALDMSPTISIPAACSDGRTGIVTATRDPSGVSGAGTIRLTDGTVAQFGFGSAAAGMLRPTAIVERRSDDTRTAQQVWFSCVISQAQQIDDGKSDVSSIGEALRTSCAAEWHAVKEEGCRSLSPVACSMFADKMDANLLSQDIQAVLAVRAKRAQSGQTEESAGRSNAANSAFPRDGAYQLISINFKTAMFVDVASIHREGDVVDVYVMNVGGLQPEDYAITLDRYKCSVNEHMYRAANMYDRNDRIIGSEPLRDAEWQIFESNSGHKMIQNFVCNNILPNGATQSTLPRRMALESAHNVFAHH